jgi:hypothetical protein
VVLEEMEDALKGMANREAVLSAVLWTCTTYLVLLAVPEPVSKGIAAVLTAAFIAWVGFDTFWSLLVGFKDLVEEADGATTFAELQQAGERYGKVMGRNAARAFVMLATAAIGSTAAGLATKVPTLPGAAQAATQAGTQLGIRLSAVEAVTAVAVSADAVTVSVAAGAVMYMDARGRAAPGTSPEGGVGQGTGKTDFPSADQLAKRLDVSKDKLHRDVKPAIVKDFGLELKKAGIRNPDIASMKLGTLFFEIRGVAHRL